MGFALVTNVLVLETNTFKASIQTSATHSYTCSYQQFSAELLTKLLLTSTHLRKWAVAAFWYSPVSTLQSQDI